ncbi:hypothetical protein EJ03DRAFT_343411 [Teratosphaeria nubilosa]|uniref:Alpha/beta hydrolase fold-3 domain-containing protein n=1 Tax=Teratosphaeria nubilosa TaxID=161662 RepID=A0A6G1L975_9PEZI|nr:hypothetical protein EJ03DRAFT_343411 [Teratosphaeria nubilosa]
MTIKDMLGKNTPRTYLIFPKGSRVTCPISTHPNRHHRDRKRNHYNYGINLQPPTSNLQLPGRLGNPDLDLEHDPRSNPKLVEFLKPWGLAANAAPPPASSTSSHEELRAQIATVDAAVEHLYNAIDMSLPTDKDEPIVERITITIKGVDNNDINLYIFRRADQKSEILPAVVYTHGGGMVFISTLNPYLASHRSELNISTIILQGEFGGGNLAIATALKANKEGWIHAISGVYASVPSIAFTHSRSDSEVLTAGLPSQVENNGYSLPRDMVGAGNAYYTPHISDHEGMAFFRSSMRAGVRATAQVNLGVLHASAMLFRRAVPEVHEVAVKSIGTFAKGL